MNGSPASRAVSDALAAFGTKPDPRLAALEPWPKDDRASAALLASVVGQDLTIAGTVRLLKEMHEELGGLGLGAQPSDWARLEWFSRRAWLKDWAHREALPGWILATSDFLRVHGEASGWPARFDPHALVRTLAAELPWMGAKSSHRIKAWRFSRWIGRGECASETTDGFRQGLRIPHPAVERPLKALSVLPSGWDSWTPSKRQGWWDGVCLEISIGDPAAAWPALDTVLSRGRNGPACQEHLGGCGRCPLRDRCPSPALR